MLPVLYYSREFQGIPIRKRQKAAWEARQRAMRHWQFWAAIAFMILATVLGHLVARDFLRKDPDGTVGAACGFLIGLAWYARTLHRIGMPYYRKILSERALPEAQLQ